VASKVDPNVNQPAPLVVAQKKDPISALVECAVESFVEALMALIWGNIVFDLIGGLLGDMIPSAPPGMSDAPVKGKHHGQHGSSGASWFGVKEHQLWILFAVFFILNLRARLSGPVVIGEKKETRWHRAARRLREEGFSLLFANAFGALVAAWAASWAVNFSWLQLCIHWAFDTIAPVLDQLSKHVFGDTQNGAVHDWWSWWGHNQFKFSFWLFYITAICDDLGIPNFKTLTRFFWRRVRRRWAGPVAAAGRQAV
jgi:hypothetical protein